MQPRLRLEMSVVFVDALDGRLPMVKSGEPAAQVVRDFGDVPRHVLPPLQEPHTMIHHERDTERPQTPKER